MNGSLKSGNGTDKRHPEAFLLYLRFLLCKILVICDGTYKIPEFFDALENLVRHIFIAFCIQLSDNLMLETTLCFACMRIVIFVFRFYTNDVDRRAYDVLNFTVQLRRLDYIYQYNLTVFIIL